jgi:hypothetical protein
MRKNRHMIASRGTFMMKLLCAVLLITGTDVFAEDTMKSAGAEIDKADHATKGS